MCFPKILRISGLQKKWHNFSDIGESVFSEHRLLYLNIYDFTDELLVKTDLDSVEPFAFKDEGKLLDVGSTDKITLERGLMIMQPLGCFPNESIRGTCLGPA
jgi:hypothetical protein